MHQDEFGPYSTRDAYEPIKEAPDGFDFYVTDDDKRRMFDRVIDSLGTDLSMERFRERVRSDMHPEVRQLEDASQADKDRRWQAALEALSRLTLEQREMLHMRLDTSQTFLFRMVMAGHEFPAAPSYRRDLLDDQETDGPQLRLARREYRSAYSNVTRQEERAVEAVRQLAFRADMGILLSSSLWKDEYEFAKELDEARTELSRLHSTILKLARFIESEEQGTTTGAHDGEH